MSKSRIFYNCSYDYLKLLKKFIKLEQISNYALSLKSESSSGPQSPGLSLSENAIIIISSILRLAIIATLGGFERPLCTDH